MNRSVYSLAFGTLALGISEFVMMAILPFVAEDLGVSIPEAGHFISAYALGVCVGAPLTTAIAFRQPLKKILLALVVLYIIGNSLAAASFSYGSLLAARFISGLPHGAYFGVGSIVAQKLSSASRATVSIAVMNAGMTVANLIGIPLSAYLANSVSWHAIFVGAAVWGCITLIAIFAMVPHVDALPDVGLKGQFRFLKHLTPLLVICATMFGNGGVFCWYSYISPQMQTLGGFTASDISLLMVLSGASMLVGNLLSGVLSDKFMPAKVDLMFQLLVVVALLGTFFLAHIAWISVVLMCVSTASLFAMSPPQQTMILKHSYGGQMMAAAFIQIAFNFGNAMGAYAGGLPIEADFSYRYPALIGVGTTLIGVASLTWYIHHQRQA